MSYGELQPSEDWSGRVARARGRRRAELEAFKADLRPMLEGARRRLSEHHDLADVETYLAACLSFIAHSRDNRSIRDMLIHVGRVLGHDRRTITVEDNRKGYEALLEELRREQPMTTALIGSSTDAAHGA
jgi:hypothetical protein